MFFSPIYDAYFWFRKVKNAPQGLDRIQLRNPAEYRKRKNIHLIQILIVFIIREMGGAQQNFLSQKFKIDKRLENY